jgi:hypothetical protein
MPLFVVSGCKKLIVEIVRRSVRQDRVANVVHEVGQAQLAGQLTQHVLVVR